MYIYIYMACNNTLIWTEKLRDIGDWHNVWWPYYIVLRCEAV